MKITSKEKRAAGRAALPASSTPGPFDTLPYKLFGITFLHSASSLPVFWPQPEANESKDPSHEQFVVFIFRVHS